MWTSKHSQLNQPHSSALLSLSYCHSLSEQDLFPLLYKANNADLISFATTFASLPLQSFKIFKWPLTWMLIATSSTFQQRMVKHYYQMLPTNSRALWLATTKSVFNLKKKVSEIEGQHNATFTTIWISASNLEPSLSSLGNLTVYLLELTAFLVTVASGMVQAWVGQKSCKRDIIRVFMMSLFCSGTLIPQEPWHFTNFYDVPFLLWDPNSTRTATF